MGGCHDDLPAAFERDDGRLTLRRLDTCLCADALFDTDSLMDHRRIYQGAPDRTITQRLLFMLADGGFHKASCANSGIDPSNTTEC